MRRLAVVCVLALLVLSAGCLGAVGFEVESETQDDDGTGSGGGSGPDPGLEPVGAELSVHYIDVGQADATFVRGPDGETMLIDTGDYRDDGETVIDYLEARGVERVDYLVSTHAHADHIGGAPAVIRHFETEHDGVGSVWDSGVPTTTNTYENYLDAIEEHDVDLIRTQAGDEIPMAGATVEVLNPPVEQSEEDEDELDPNSVAVRIGYGDAGFLFTGDMTIETEPELVDRWRDGLQSTVYQAGHHGSDTSSSAEFLDAVAPRIAVVSSAHDSQYDHPREEVLARFAERGIDTYWTGTHGTIVAGTDGDAVTISTVAEAPTDASELRDAPSSDAAASAEIEARGTYDAGSPSSTLISSGSVARTAVEPAIAAPATGATVIGAPTTGAPSAGAKTVPTGGVSP